MTLGFSSASVTLSAIQVPTFQQLCWFRTLVAGNRKQPSWLKHKREGVLLGGPQVSPSAQGCGHSWLRKGPWPEPGAACRGDRTPFPPLVRGLSGSLHPLVFSASRPHGAVRRRGCDLEKPSLVHRCLCPGFCTRVCKVRCDLEGRGLCWCL